MGDFKNRGFSIFLLTLLTVLFLPLEAYAVAEREGEYTTPGINPDPIEYMSPGFPDPGGDELPRMSPGFPDPDGDDRVFIPYTDNLGNSRVESVPASQAKKRARELETLGFTAGKSFKSLSLAEKRGKRLGDRARKHGKK